MNGSGNIEVGISEGTAASIDVDSERGAVHNFVSSQGELWPVGPQGHGSRPHAARRHHHSTRSKLTLTKRA